MLLSHKHNDSGHTHPITASAMNVSGKNFDSGPYQYQERVSIGTGYANLGNAVKYDSNIPVTPGAENRPSNYTIRIWKRIS